MFPDGEGWPHHGPEELAAVAEVLASGRTNAWTGHRVRAFEAAFARSCGVAHGVAVANGTLALELALLAAGVGPGDEVLVTPRSFVASASAVLRVGAAPVFADVDRDSQNLDPRACAARSTRRTRAALIVHLAGWPTEWAPFRDLARDRDLVLVEDCAQAHGALLDEVPVGALGHVAAFSFCQDKILSTGGEGGMVVTDDARIAERAWSFKDHGKDRTLMNAPPGPDYRYVHAGPGDNWRLTEMQAAIGLLQLARLPEWRARRRAAAARLLDAFARHPCFRVPRPRAGAVHAHYRAYAFVEPSALAAGWDRARVLDALRAEGVPCGVGACPELYREGVFSAPEMARHCPVAVELGRTAIMVNLHHRLSGGTLARWCAAIDAVGEAASGRSPSALRAGAVMP